MIHLRLATLVACCLILKTAAGVSFDGFRQYRLTPMSDKALERLRWLERRFPSEPDPQAGLIFLTGPGQKFESVDLLVPPRLESALLSVVQATHAMRMRLIHEDYGRLLAQLNSENDQARLQSDDAQSRQRREAVDGREGEGRLQLAHNFYRSFREIRRVLVQLSDRCNQIRRGTCSLQTIGQTGEGRELLVLKIAKNPLSSTDAQRTTVWLDAGIHSREWVSPATALYIADQLVNVGLPASLGNASQLSASAKEAAEIVERHQILILTLYNPDGYEHSRLRNRMWRKNRERNSHRRFCRGVDLNRNYGFAWGGVGSSSNPCADNFRGLQPFTAAETAAVKRFVEHRKTNLLMFLSLHSYGQFVLLPYGYRKKTYSKTHHKKMMCAASLAILKMFAVNDRFYALGTGSDLLYEANGGSDDWAHGSLGIPYSYTFELPDEGDYGFLLPAREVPGIGSEMMRGLGALLAAARRLEASSVESADALAECSELMDSNLS